MLKHAEAVLGHGTPISLAMVRLVRSLGPESAHVLAATDPASARQARIDSRREWPDSALSDVPDRYPLFELMHSTDMMVWPELGAAVDDNGVVAAHLHDAGQWLLIGDASVGEVITMQLPSGRYVARTMTPRLTGSGFVFNDAMSFLAAVSKASAHIAGLYARLHEPQDRG